MALPSTTIVPFAALPSCARMCGPLYDANGKCVPPYVPTASPDVYKTCFCDNKYIQGFFQGTSGVCDNACPDGGLSDIHAWVTSFCTGKDITSSSTPSTSATGSAVTSSTPEVTMLTGTNSATLTAATPADSASAADVASSTSSPSPAQAADGSSATGLGTSASLGLALGTFLGLVIFLL